MAQDGIDQGAVEDGPDERAADFQGIGISGDTTSVAEIKLNTVMRRSAT